MLGHCGNSVFCWDVLVLRICVVLIVCQPVHPYHPSKTEFLNALLVDYNHEAPPMFDRGDVCDVLVSVYVNSFNSLKETDMEFTTDLIVQQQWRDDRLRFHGLVSSRYVELDSRLSNRLWVPDLFFVNEKQASFRDIPVANKMLHLYGNGSIVYKARLTVTATCPLDLKNYPMDRQLCSLFIQSFGFSTHSLKLHWAPDPLRSSSGTELPHFNIVRSSVSHCDGLSDQGNFTCLQVDFYLQRYLGFYILQMYVPSCLVVVVSWLSFWIHPGAVSGRTSLGILTVLTLTTQGTASMDSLPKVSYIKASDVWMAVCLFFVFAAFLQYAVVCVTARAQRSPPRGALPSQPCRPHCKGQTQLTSQTTGRQCRNQNRGGVEVEISGAVAKRIDVVSRVAFPALFFAFIVVYCLYFSLWASYVF